MRFKIFILIGLIGFLLSCGNSKKLPVKEYYNYDAKLPLRDSVQIIQETDSTRLSYFTFQSVHNKKVTGLLSVPRNSNQPLPVIVLLHGKGDRKTVDYIEFGNTMLTKAGYAVLRIDFEEHGDRKENDYEFDFTGETKYWTRNIISQTIFDLQRTVDFIETRKELDADRIGFCGVSLGGVAGTIFCGLDKRIKVPVIVLAGGQLNLIFGKKALTAEAKEYTGIIEPKNFVKQISPRPLLMINAENDDIIKPIMSKMLYKKAKNPKEIIWYPAKHHTIPIEKVYQEGIIWYDKYLK